MRRTIETVVKNLFENIGISISYVKENEDDPNILEIVLNGAISVKTPLNIVHIGANDGKWNDPIYNFVKNHSTSTNVILVEPQEELISKLSDNYAFHPSHKILNLAISENDKPITLYKVKKEYWADVNASYGSDWPRYRIPSGVTTNNREKLIEWVEANVDYDSQPDDVIGEAEVEAITPKELMSRQNLIDNVDFLQIDTEGMDDKIVNSFFNDGIYPNIINFEDKHLSDIAIEQLELKLDADGYVTRKYSACDRLALIDRT